MEKIKRYVVFGHFNLPFTRNVKIKIQQIYHNKKDIKSIKIDINISQNGTAHVTETWEVHINNHEDITELYKPYYNYGNSKFENFKVSLNNKNYTFEQFWDIDENFENFQTIKYFLNYFYLNLLK